MRDTVGFFATILQSSASFALAVLFVTWVAIVLLGLIGVSLHVRLQRLERSGGQRIQDVPFRHLLGKTVDEILNGAAPRPRPRLILFLSPSCLMCERLVAELRSRSGPSPVAVIWTSADLAQLPELPSHVTVVTDGARISTSLGIRVTPFALVAGDDGAIIHASPVNSLDALYEGVARPRAASLFLPSR
jgi:hypothetical protein